jgi:phosphate transport system substrate-binding protein
VLPTPTPTQPAIAATPVVVRVGGANAMVPLMQELARSYEQGHPGVVFEIAGGGSRWGLSAVLGQQLDIGMVSHPVAVAALAGAGGEARLQATEIARDAVVIVVHPSNPLRTLSRQQVADLFSGALFRWDDLGWLANEVQVLSREPGSGDRAVLEAYALTQHPLTLNALIMPSPQAMTEYIASHPEAIGYLSRAQLTSSVKALAIEGVAPSLTTMADGSYPLTRPLLLVTREGAGEEVRGLLGWVLGAEARVILERRYVP